MFVTCSSMSPRNLNGIIKMCEKSEFKFSEFICNSRKVWLAFLGDEQHHKICKPRIENR